MEDFKKILCEDLLIVNISVGTVYVSIIFLSFLFFYILAVCNPWGHGGGVGRGLG